jgi:glycosyltransferase involved in cell wall biosynthesis
MARKVLMIVYYYPPLGGIGGMRTLRLASRLPSLGWEPLILTVSEGTLAVIRRDAADGDLEGVRVFRTFNPDLAFKAKRLAGFDVSKTVDDAPGVGGSGPKARLARGVSDWLGIPDRFVDWYPFALRRALQVCREYAPEVILTSAPPDTCHLIAASVKRRALLPWVADMRDPWIDSFYSRGYTIPGRINSWLEKRTLSRADVVTAVIEPIREDIAHRLSVPVVHVPNSYDERLLASAEPLVEGGLNILYAGSLFYPRRDPRPVFRALRRMREGGRDISRIRIQFAGHDAGVAEGLARAEGVDANVEILGLLTPEEVISREKGAAALLYIQNFNADPESGMVTLTEGPTGKLLEYIGTGRPVLSLMPSMGSAEDLLRETGSGEAARNDGDVRGTLEHWLDEFEKTGSLASRSRPEAIASYSSQAMAERFASLFEELAGGAGGAPAEGSVA